MVIANYSHAQACRKICNFSSLGAIMGALESKAISSLTLTHKRMLPEERHSYQKLVDFLKSDSNYDTYRKTLSKVESRGCIPWHGAHFRLISVLPYA
jgi:RasGEF domain